MNIKVRTKTPLQFLLTVLVLAALALNFLPGSFSANAEEKANHKRPTVLLILDGFGLNEQREHNAIAMAETPVLDRLMKECPFVKGNASGLAVGLPEGQMGSSEVGHLNIGAGRIVYQDLTRISKKIEDGDFFENEALLKAVDNAKEKGTSLHLYGLVSDGGVHSHNTHLYALLDLAKRHGLEKVYVHCFLDGRDTPPESGKDYVQALQEEMDRIGCGRIATVAGRYYAMDRDNNWDRIEKAYRAMTLGEGVTASSAAEAVTQSYQKGETDEFVQPTVVMEDGVPVATIDDGDSIIFFNFRPDRAREITRAFCCDEFDSFDRGPRKQVTYVCFTDYDVTIPNKDVAFEKEALTNTFGEWLAANHMKQARIAETEKYAHVTFFFNGGVEAPNEGEDRFMIPSPKVATYDLQPEMSAEAVCDTLIEKIRSGEYDVIITNFANSDMVGHTGVEKAAIEAVECIDKCIGRIVEAIEDTDGQLFICADHGNAEVMADDKTGEPWTAHTTNPVPFILVNYDPAYTLREGGCLADIAPTLIEMMGMEKPAEMTGESLLVKAEGEADTPFSQWNTDAPSLKALIGYVEAVTDETSPDYIPPADRIATFDMDGTLSAELAPTYLEVMLLTERILRDTSWQPDEEMLEFGRMTRDHAPDKSFPADYDYEFSYHQAKAFAGMTLTEYADFITRFLVREADGFEGMTYANAYYLPMAEVVEYLQDNGFKCYIVTGSDRFIARTFLEGILDIPYENIIGSDTALEAKNQGDTDGIEYVFTGDDMLVRTDRLLIKDLKTNKVLQIAQEIGRQPVLSFGNSSGDVSMHNYALCNNRYRSAAFQLIADDDVRDYGNPEKGPGLREQWEGMGYNVISMRDDWKTIYGEDVVKTGTFHWLENYADDKVDEVEAARKAAAEDPYTLEQVVILSRHNIRSPLSGSGSLLGDITPHQWFEWTSNPSELSLRGAMLETLMGQYFRLWLEDEGLFPENWKPEDGAVRFYANSKQRTLATARYFSAGLLPVAVVPVENHAEYDTMDPVFNPALTLLTDEYEKDVVAQIAEMGGVAGLKGIHAGLMDAIQLLMDVTDMEESKAYQSGQFGDLLADETTIKLELGKEPAMTGPIKTATSVADALTFQFYEMADEKAAAFGHDLTRDDWRKIHSIVDTYTKMLFETPLIAANAAHPLLQEIRSELTAEGRKFSFLCGHDSNVAGVLSVLGAEEYTLPDTVEPMTPIGVKLVFERWSSADGEDYARVRLVYQSTEQLRGIIPLSLENPPVSFDIDLSGLERNADGYYRMDDVLERFRNAIAAYDTLVETYGGEEAQMDDAA